MTPNLFKIVGIFGGGTVLFYTLGFTIVKTYMHKIGLEGMFWLTKEFYVDAGANFLLEMISAPLLTPHIFFIYLILLFLLLPREKKLVALDSTGKKGLSVAAISTIRKQRLKLFVLLAVIVVTGLFASQYEYLMGKIWFSRMINTMVFDPTATELSTAKKSLAFFSFVSPLLIVMSTFLYRYFGAMKESPRIKMLYQLTAVISLVFMALIPISYGLHLYDWKLVPIKDPRIISNIIERERGSAVPDSDDENLRIWLFGNFDDKYFFFTKRGLSGEGAIEVIDEDKINLLNFDPYKANSLRTEIQEAFDQEELETIDSDEDAFDFLGLE